MLDMVDRLSFSSWSCVGLVVLLVASFMLLRRC